MEDKINVKVGKLVSYLSSLYKAGEDIGRFSILLLGAPGIGKSYSLKETARSITKRMGKTFIDYSDDLYTTIMAEPDKYFVFIDFRLTECEPSDLSGIPERINGGVRFSPLLWAIVLSKCAGLLCLDELPNVQRPDMISVSYKLIFDQKGY